MWQPLFVDPALFLLHRPFETPFALHPFLDPPPHSSSSSIAARFRPSLGDHSLSNRYVRSCGVRSLANSPFALLKQGNPTAAAHPTLLLQLPSIAPITPRFPSIC